MRRFALALAIAGSMALFLQAQVRQPGELTRLADKYGTDKGSRGHNYAEVYGYFFEPMRNRARKVLEIGVATGASLSMFGDYFSKAVIFGIDIDDKSRLNSARIRTFVADQGDRKQLARFIAAAGSGFDLIVDDGGHTMAQQQVSFAFLFPHVKPDGYFIIEDVHTSLLGGYGIDPDRQNTTLAMIENFIRTGGIVSRYMTRDEAGSLAAHIKYCNLFKGEDGRSITCILKKK